MCLRVDSIAGTVTGRGLENANLLKVSNCLGDHAGTARQLADCELAHSLILKKDLSL